MSVSLCLSFSSGAFSIFCSSLHLTMSLFISPAGQTVVLLYLEGETEANYSMEWDWRLRRQPHCLPTSQPLHAWSVDKNPIGVLALSSAFYDLFLLICLHPLLILRCIILFLLLLFLTVVLSLSSFFPQLFLLLGLLISFILLLLLIFH